MFVIDARASKSAKHCISMAWAVTVPVGESTLIHYDRIYIYMKVYIKHTMYSRNIDEMFKFGDLANFFKGREISLTCTCNTCIHVNVNANLNSTNIHVYQMRAISPNLMLANVVCHTVT